VTTRNSDEESVVIESRDPASLVSVVDATVGMAGPQYDVFVDLSDAGMNRQTLSEHLEALAGDAGLNSAAGRVTAVIPVDMDPPASMPNLTAIDAGASKASDALHRAIRGAARHGRHLVVVLNSLLPANEVLCRLIQELDRDPLFGMVQPRFADASNDHVWPLPGTDAADGRPTLSRAGLAFLPEILITPELLSSCIVIRREVVREMDRSDCRLSIAGELRRLLTQSRRRGFRNVVVNRAVIASRLPYAGLYPSLPATDAEQLRAMYPEIVRADSWCANLPQPKLESILAHAYADDSHQTPRLLLDCRGMISMHNGTSHSILGLLDGFQALDCSWQIEAVASSAVIEFFKLRKRYRKFDWIADNPRDTYMAAVLLNQPWGLSTIAELHRHALLVGFHMLDTISWDILYVCDERLDAVWRFIARYSDALFYLSQFTRDRFANRFPPQAHVAERVMYLSLAKDEQVDGSVLGVPAGDHILLFGNDYDHKDIRRTLQILVDAFPYAKVVVIGIDGSGLRNVVTMPSGAIEHTVLHRLIATARVIVFPSFYEGFGMPVVQGLAYGRTVVARRSPLWQEIAAQVQMPGRLVQFDSTASLVEAVGRTLAGHPLNSLPQGAALGAGQSPLRWQDCAQRMIGTLQKLLPFADGRRWLEREEALRAIDLLHY
jgi:glycosyltransferase involved in cell wall biosynthesis